MKTETPRTDELRNRYDADLISGIEIIDAYAKIERELNEAKELMKTAAIWIEDCPFENSIPLGLKLRAAAMPNISVGCKPRISSLPDVQPDGPRGDAKYTNGCQTNKEAAPMSGYAVPSRAAGGEDSKL
jgi:hypothetical protein